MVLLQIEIQFTFLHDKTLSITLHTILSLCKLTNSSNFNPSLHTYKIHLISFFLQKTYDICMPTMMFIFKVQIQTLWSFLFWGSIFLYSNFVLFWIILSFHKTFLLLCERMVMGKFLSFSILPMLFFFVTWKGLSFLPEYYRLQQPTYITKWN